MKKGDNQNRNGQCQRSSYKPAKLGTGPSAGEPAANRNHYSTNSFNINSTVRIAGALA